MNSQNKGKIVRSRPLVFVSSTSDLEPLRRTIADALRPTFDAYLFEEDRPRGDTPREHCRRVINESEVFLGIVGARYGSCLGEGDARSICEWEFDTASERDGIEIMMMLSRVEDPTRIEPEQRRFRDRVSGFGRGVWCRFFHSTQDLVLSVRQALTTWLVEFFCQSAEKRAEGRRWARRFAIPMAVVAVMALIAAVALNIGFGWFTTVQLLGICAASFALVLLGMLVVLAAR
jgi:hypothetical protein